jgi:hypothetical protein
MQNIENNLLFFFFFFSAAERHLIVAPRHNTHFGPGEAPGLQSVDPDSLAAQKNNGRPLVRSPVGE